MINYSNHTAIVYEHQLVIDEFHTVKVKQKRGFKVVNHFPTFDDIILFLNKHLLMNKLTSEHLFVVGFAGLTLTGILEIGRGSENKCSYSDKDIIRYLLLTGSGSFIMAHNHPIADCSPSLTDMVNHEKIKNLAQVFDMNFINEFIISGNEYYDVNNNCRRFIKEGI